jgi:electron transport complex protein RnfD
LLILGGIYLLIKKVITWHIPVSIIVTAAIMSGIFWLVNPELYINPIYHVLTGGLMLGAIFMATDMVSSPMTPKGQLIYGVGIGVITILIRFFGAYPEGISFAILIMNAMVPLLNRYVKPKRFGELKKQLVKG